MKDFEICPVCGVKISTNPNDSAPVKFNFGKSGTPARLASRVCQFTTSPDCINRKVEPTLEDGYSNYP